ncbi:uncharacterized protein A4U43_C04F220 [Asparagus officinalis]|uniref:Uncharacterized protein n=1 Tax=Asparagus officinalis TaxID=4686 RepID=A0A5P1EYX6_ASPOF|nr:uncharacterized protein A4U43_C04F220 [Asparagus officinalis]
METGPRYPSSVAGARGPEVGGGSGGRKLGGRERRIGRWNERPGKETVVSAQVHQRRPKETDLTAIWRGGEEEKEKRKQRRRRRH